MSLDGEVTEHDERSTIEAQPSDGGTRAGEASAARDANIFYIEWNDPRNRRLMQCVQESPAPDGSESSPGASSGPGDGGVVERDVPGMRLSGTDVDDTAEHHVRPAETIEEAVNRAWLAMMIHLNLRPSDIGESYFWRGLELLEPFVTLSGVVIESAMNAQVRQFEEAPDADHNQMDPGNVEPDNRLHACVRWVQKLLRGTP